MFFSIQCLAIFNIMYSVIDNTCNYICYFHLYSSHSSIAFIKKTVPEISVETRIKLHKIPIKYVKSLKYINKQAVRLQLVCLVPI